MLVKFDFGLFKLLPLKSINFYTNFYLLKLFILQTFFLFFLCKKSPDNEKILKNKQNERNKQTNTKETNKDITAGI